MTETPHRIVNPDELPMAVGYAHAVVAAPGRTVYLGGQVGLGHDGLPEGLADQFDVACANVVTALRAAGGEPQHLVSMLIFTTDIESYGAVSEDLGTAYRRHFGKHYPAIALVEVSRLFEPGALVELSCTAVIPEEG